MEGRAENPLRLKSVNHISLVCRSVEKSLDFYQKVLGFFSIRRPGSFDFDGAWYESMRYGKDEWDKTILDFLELRVFDLVVINFPIFFFCFDDLGYTIMAWAYISCNLKTLTTCPRSACRLIPRTTTFHFKYVSLSLSVWF